MRNTVLLAKSNSKSESVGDSPCLKDISEPHQSQNKIENALEISQVRFFFEPKESDDYDECYHPEVPSHEDMIKLINLTEDQDTLQITLRLDDIEEKLKLDTSQKILCKTIQFHNNFPQNKYKGDDYEIRLHQEYGEDKIVNTDSCTLLNRNFFEQKSPETTDKEYTLKCETTTETNLIETKHGDLQTDTKATDLTPVSTLEPKSSLSKCFTDSSVQCEKLQEDFVYFKNFLSKEAETSYSFSSTSKETESNTIPEINSKVIIHAHTQTENSSDFMHSYHDTALDKSYFPQGSSQRDIENNINNQPGFLNSSISSLHTLISDWVKASTNKGLPFIGQNDVSKNITSTTLETGADLATSNPHSMNAKNESKDFCSDLIESIPTMEVTNKISNSSLNNYLKLPTLNCILSKTEEMGCNMSNQTNKDFLYSKNSETLKNFKLNGNNLAITSLNSEQNANENLHFFFPQSSTSNKRSQTTAWVTNENRLSSFDSNAKIQDEIFNADCVAGGSKTEKTLLIPTRTSNSVPEWTAKSFDFVRREPLEPIIENLACEELVEPPKRVHQNPCPFSSIDCSKVSEDCKEDLINVRSTLSIGSCDFRLVFTEEPQNKVMPVVFSRKSHPHSETNGHFVICLCDDCYTRTQQTVDRNLVNISDKPAMDNVEFKPICIELSSPTDEETPLESEIVVSETASVNSVIENVYPLCEALNNHLLGLKKVDEDLLTKSKDSLTTKWLTVATDRYSRPKEVYNYLQYFQKFSDTLAKFVLHSTDPEGNNALHFAYGNNRFDMVEELLNNKHGPALLKKRNKLGYTPLMICAVSLPETQEDWNTVRKSVEMGNINEASPSSGQTALMNAASRGLQDMVRILLSAGADPNQRDRDGSTALMYATEHGRDACVALILEHPGCDPLIKDQDGQTASSIAIGAGHKDIALQIYLHTKKILPSAMQQAMKIHKKKNPPYKKL